MLARAMSTVLDGVEATPVTVEVDIASGLPAFTIVGLPDATVQEARDRVRGVILDGLRMVAHGASLKTAKDVAEQPLIGAHKLPKRLGGGQCAGRVANDAVADDLGVTASEIGQR